MLQLNGNAFEAFSMLNSIRTKQGVVAAVRLLDAARKKSGTTANTNEGDVE